MTKRQEIVDNLEQLLDVLPPDIRDVLIGMDNLSELLEIVLDLGRRPEARFPDGFVYLSEEPVTREDIDYVVRRVGEFGDDNRAGIERTLHRISAIRNRKGTIIGLTCRIGRAVFGTIDIIRDVIESGKSILLLGRPGVGKTTMLRETARVLADELNKRVIIVDTSNEIAGDGDVPHPAIGHARRMQVPHSTRQADVMIEAVENHMPEVIVIDEISTEAEALAARTIAERGVQLVATAHGNTLENLVLNPTLSDLIGGIQAVTLGDEEARKRGTQKTVLERKAPPTFPVVIEIQDRDRLAVHHDVASTVDRLLRGLEPRPEIRQRTQDGAIDIRPSEQPEEPAPVTVPAVPAVSAVLEPAPANGQRLRAGGGLIRVYPYAVSRNRLERAIAETGAPVRVTDDPHQAHIVLTLKGQYRKMPKKLREVERSGVPIHVIRSNTLTQIQAFLVNLMDGGEAETEALLEAEAAIQQVRRERRPVDLSPRPPYLRRLQHELAERAQFKSVSVGEEPYRRVRILPVRIDEDGELDEDSF
ncbi:MAG: R3H domain-containing nucleic acid-binding protein [Limnochordales bacterium]